ncbi:hypothetical protein [Candidatus Sororendozoicomonas aggregata]|uniref:hypothetical protein n=1 Tax=Candidatus Sororendozoicomonas aggregata TaxID=3073239 RepID=UPI002ED40A39
MFYKSIQCPSVAVLSLAFFCVAHAATAHAKVYSVTNHGTGTKSTYKTKYDPDEFVSTISQLNITVPKFGKQNYVEIKADVYIGLGHDLLAACKGNYFDFGMVGDVSHGGHFGKDRFTLRVWCCFSGSGGYIARASLPLVGNPIVNHISCKRG